MTSEEIEDELRDVGLEPDEVGARMQAAVEEALAKAHRERREEAAKELAEERARMAEARWSQPRGRAEIIAAIEHLSAQFGGQVRYAYRNLESETDEDLASLLEDLEYLASRQHEGDEEE
jgi:predicted metal-dependent hydrolase